MARLRATFDAVGYAGCVPFGRAGEGSGRIGVLFKGVDETVVDPARRVTIEAAFGLRDASSADGSHLLRNDDPRRGHARRVLVRSGALEAVALVGDRSAGRRLREYLEAGAPEALGRLLRMIASTRGTVSA